MKSNKVILASLMGIAVVGTAALTFATSSVAAQEANGNGIFSRVSEILNIGETDLTSAFETARNEKIDSAVVEGKITEEQATRMKENVGQGHSFRFDVREKHGMEFGGENREEHKQEMADLFGLSTEAMEEAREEGKSLEALASENGVSVDDVKSFMKSNMEESLTQAVEDGKLDEDKKAEILEKMDEKIEEMVSRAPGEQRDGEGMMKGEMGRGQGGPGEREQ